MLGVAKHFRLILNTSVIFSFDANPEATGADTTSMPATWQASLRPSQRRLSMLRFRLADFHA